MKTLLLITALCLPIMAQTQQSLVPSDPSASIKAAVAAHIEQARAFAEAVVKDPMLLEQTAKANRAKMGAGAGRDVYNPAVGAQSLMAEQLYQIQEDISLDAAIRAAKLIAGLPSFTKVQIGEKRGGR